MPKYVATLINPMEIVHIEAVNHKQACDKALQKYYHRYGEIELYDETNPEHQILEKEQFIYAVYCRYHEKPIRYMLPLENESFESIEKRIKNIYGKHLDKVEEINKKNACVYMTEDGMQGLKSTEEIYHNYHGFLTLQEARTLLEAAKINSSPSSSKIDVLLLLEALHFYRAVHYLVKEY